MKDLLIRRAEISDLEKLAEIEKSYIDYPAWGVNGLKAEMEKDFSNTFVVEYKKKITGFINFWIIKPKLEINAIVISPCHVRKGFGSALINKALEYGTKNNCEHACLEVRENNIVALKFYKKHGFYETGRRIKYYNDSCDAILMTRKIRYERSEI